MRIVLSPVGTSILTNQAGDQRSFLNKYANTPRSEIHQDVIELVEEFRLMAVGNLTTASMADLQRASAELNGIIGLDF